MNGNKDAHLLFAALYFSLLFLASFLECFKTPHYFFLALSGCGGAMLAVYMSIAAPVQKIRYDDAAASAILFYRERADIQEKDITYLRHQTTSLEAALESKTQEVIGLDKTVASLEAALEAAQARGAQDPPQNTLPTADKLYRKLALKYHPDHNHNAPKVARAEVMTDLNTLWQRVKAGAR